MFVKAVQQHNPGPGLKGNTFSQHPKNNADPLKPTASSTLNNPRTHSHAQNNPLKRTASQANDGGLWWGGQEETIKRTPMIDPATNGDRVGQLHVNVFFDENDFEDDNNIDLDEEDLPMTKKTQSSVDSLATLQPIPNLKASTTPQTPGSSTPLPWSSSPLAHHQMPPPDIPSKMAPAPIANAAKRRKLPWIEEQSLQDHKTATEYQSGGPPDHVKDIIARNKEYKAVRKASVSSYTPLPKDKQTPFPWNTTASAVKEEQKRLRQGNKKLIRNNEGDIGKSSVKKRRETVARVFLSDEQKSVLDLVAEKKKSVFFTGSAGTGKSVLLRETIKVLRDKYKREPDRVAVTASTGLAACNVGGVTLHSFAGIGLGKEPVPELVKKIKRNQKAKNRWMRTKVLIIDEISMVDGDLFDKLEAIARSIRNNGRPFGGIQLVITGDFFQLPPVPDYGKISKFSFDAATWNTSIEHTIGLTQVFRQKDPVFANMLNEMRLGRLTPKSIEAFRALNRPLSFADDFEATELFPTRNEVDSANTARMKNLTGRDFEFRAEDSGSIQDHAQREKLLSNCMAPPSITLKKGAQVMLIKNIDDTLVNGSVGKVVAFMDEKTFDIYHEDEDEFQAVERMDLDHEEMTRSRMKLKQLINKDLAGDTSHKWPLVRFAIADGSSRDLLCQRESWKIELPNGEVQASRAQVPLILAWALSIHKAQGQTLDRVKVDLGKIFEKGQAYVALSRATCQEGLQISRFDPKKVMAHDRVRTFYDSLYSIDQATALSGQKTALKKTVAAKNYEQGFVQAEEDEDALSEMMAR